MSQSKSSRFILSVLCTVVTLAVTAAESDREAQLVTAHVSPGQIAWEPLAAGGKALSVTVTGPGEYAFTHIYQKNELAIFDAVDPEGNPLPDGTYNYEIKELSDNPKARPKDDKQGLPEKSRGQRPLFLTQSGTFTIVAGSIVDPSLAESSDASGSASSTMAPSAVGADPVLTPEGGGYIVEDTEIAGSLCVGMDCVNGENFGFDTIKMKENNTRIKFDDTSSSGSFPNVDWQLEANESNNGGANRFSIWDSSNNRRIFSLEALAPTNSLYVDDGGRVGFGTMTPVVQLHSVNGNTPTLRLDQDGSSGFTPQVWDVAGNEANFFIRDATNGSKLPFRIKPGAATNSLVIDPSGNVVLGAESGSARLHVSTGTVNGGMLVAASTGQPDIRLEKSDQASSDGNWRVFVNNIGNLLIRHNDTDSTSPIKVYGEAVENLMVIGASTSGVNNTSDPDRVTINGELWVNGTMVPDYVFEDTFPLESIEEHASFMWENKRLPGLRGTIKKGDDNSTVNLAEHQYGILEELEKAHIYIEQLHKRLAALEEKLSEMAEETSVDQ